MGSLDSLETSGLAAILAIALVIVIAALGVVLWKSTRHEAAIRNAERLLSGYLGEAVRLSEAGKHLAAHDRRIERLVQDITRLKSVDRFWAGSIEALEYSLAGAEKALSSIPEASKPGGPLELFGAAAGLSGARKACEVLKAATQPAVAIRHILDTSDDLNGALTLPSALTAYLSDDVALSAFLKEFRAVEALYLLCLRKADVSIIVPQPLQILEPGGATIVPQKEAQRQIHALLPVRRRLGEAVRSAPRRGDMVVDCFAPGFSSKDIGHRKAQCTIFEASG